MQLVPPASLVIGEGTATVSGEWFFSGCDDIGQGSGCGARRSEEVPLRDVELVLEQGPRSVVRTTADASSKQEHYATIWKAQVPAGFLRRSDPSRRQRIAHRHTASLTASVLPNAAWV